ncbi:hypothetical protein [Sarcina ventriculi]|uniref:hypothetical protein n=1 Tax=Sarcina ventriculi TaxID=1267 RepID=UPI00073E6708|nr:hypothetical protein [Sarcina ventriculi]
MPEVFQNCDKCEYDLFRNFYCLYYLTVKVGEISVIIYIPHALLKDEKEVRKYFKVVKWQVFYTFMACHIAIAYLCIIISSYIISMSLEISCFVL